MLKAQKRATGSFYTCLSIADYIVRWAITDEDTKVLEPSFGDGSFLYSAITRFNELGRFDPQIYGVELQEEPFYNFVNTNDTVECSLTDFMDYRPNCGVDAVIGNPPYVSLRNLSTQDRNKAISLMSKYGIDMPPSSSLWMPFIVHATEMLNDNGRLGFVLPYEITYVRYAFKLWNYLKRNYGKLSIYRVYTDFFPEVDIEPIVFLAENKGGCTDSVEYKTFQDITDLFCGKTIVNSSIPIADISSLNKPFERELISPNVKEIISSLREEGQLTSLLGECKFKIGYVCGNKSYFHPTQDTVKKYKIKAENLIPCLINSKDINNQSNMGLDTINAISESRLFYPTKMGKGEKAYISYGEAKQVHLAYKCKIRNPWYITPNIETPDIILTVFGDVPKMIANTGGYIIANSLLCGIINNTKETSSKELVCRWYNSLTLLLIEMYIHSLGGGTLVFIPGEMDKMEIVSDYPKAKINDVFERLNECMISKGVSDTYLLGDELVLKQIYNLSNADVQEIRNSLDILRSWRRPDLRR
ncbi:MAG: SAM-dependent methyltransferase [Lachnospiraceae bacterium]|nr:SAM-dependent methyltransferase [Lachnospiraceae bacterium]